MRLQHEIVCERLVDWGHRHIPMLTHPLDISVVCSLLTMDVCRISFHDFLISVCRSGRTGRLMGAGNYGQKGTANPACREHLLPLHAPTAAEATSQDVSYMTFWDETVLLWLGASRALAAGLEDVRDNTSSSSNSPSRSSDTVREKHLPQTRHRAPSGNPMIFSFYCPPTKPLAVTLYFDSHFRFY